ncbi:unnamed protein product [Lactuca saligna]|uniref:Importin N-terminal domain-containing protein n=1 Tax=Lactuca saligna TaxID=75948 RepID=A0AA35ZHV9_LACSI|nr:unnamed protein product [Lactuca saligna]
MLTLVNCHVLAIYGHGVVLIKIVVIFPVAMPWWPNAMLRALVRQVASIHFKNFIAENRSPHDPDERSKILPSDKDLVRQNILVFVEQVPTLLREQLGECLKTIIHVDYPEQWSGLLHWVTLKLLHIELLTLCSLAYRDSSLHDCKKAYEAKDVEVLSEAKKITGAPADTTSPSSM